MGFGGSVRSSEPGWRTTLFPTLRPCSSAGKLDTHNTRRLAACMGSPVFECAVAEPFTLRSRRAPAGKEGEGQGLRADPRRLSAPQEAQGRERRGALKHSSCPRSIDRLSVARVVGRTASVFGSGRLLTVKLLKYIYLMFIFTRLSTRRPARTKKEGAKKVLMPVHGA